MITYVFKNDRVLHISKLLCWKMSNICVYKITIWNGHLCAL